MISSRRSCSSRSVRFRKGALIVGLISVTLLVFDSACSGIGNMVAFNVFSASILLDLQKSFGCREAADNHPGRQYDEYCSRT